MGQDVAAVAAMSANLFHPQAVPDTDLLLLRFAEGALGEVTSIGYRDTTMVNVTEIVCEAGSVRLDLSGAVQIMRDGQAETLADAVEPDWMLRGVEREWQALAAMIGGAKPAVSAQAAGHLIACIEAARQAATLRREVAVQAWD